MELHPSPTARRGNIPSDAVTKGIHKEVGPFLSFGAVWCQQCGFRCHLSRDARNLNQFVGETITSGNKLTNGSFENWTGSTPDNWTLSGSVSQETTRGLFDWRDDGASSVKIVRSGSDIQLSQSPSTPSDFNDNYVRFGVRVKSDTLGVIRLQVDINSVTHQSSYNIAQQRFQELVIGFQAPVSVSSMTVYVKADAANGTAYIDSATLARDGAPTTSAIDSGCPHCGSSLYFG